MHYKDKAREAGSTAQPWRCVATHVLTAPTRTGLQCSADHPDSEQVCGLLLMMLACCRTWIRARVAMFSCEAAILAVPLGKLVSGSQEPAAATSTADRRPQTAGAQLPQLQGAPASDRRCAPPQLQGGPGANVSMLGRCMPACLRSIVHKPARRYACCPKAGRGMQSPPRTM